jgi:hypothetical protein
MRSQFSHIILLAICALVVFEPYNGIAQTYTFDGRSLQRWQGNPQTLRVTEWQIWLYKRGQTVGGADHWGTISASSAAKVSAQLLSGQAFEQSYCKFFGHPLNCESNMTYFNPLGPIAIMEPEKTVPQRILDDFTSLKESKEKLKQLMDLYTDLQAAYNPYSYKGDGEPFNPYEGVGTFVMDYGASLKAAADRLKEASETLNRLNDSSERTISSELNQFDGVANDQASRVASLQADSGEIKAKYTALSKSGTLAPTSPSPSASWMHATYDDGDGDQIKKITIDAFVKSDAVIVRQVNVRSDSTETVDTRLAFADIRYVGARSMHTNRRVVTDEEGTNSLTFHLADDKVYTVEIVGNSSNAFKIRSMTRDNSGKQQMNDSSTTRYMFTFNDEASANACQDFINARIRR